jgi:cell division protein FtsL
MDPTSLGRTVLTFVLLLCSLGLVTWRQSRALEANRELDELRRHVSVAQAERVELEREIQVLRSRSRIVAEARVLGMHTPGGDEQFILVTQDAP